MKNLFPSIALFSILTLSITSCSVESLDDQGLQDSEAFLYNAKNDVQQEITTLYIQWNDGVTELEKENFRQKLMSYETPLFLNYYDILDVSQKKEQWGITFDSQASNDENSKKWLKKKKEIDMVSVEPF